MFKRPDFLLYLGRGIFSMLGYFMLLFSVANFSLAVGLSPHQGSIVSAILNLGQCFGRPLVGLSSDRLGRMNIAGVLTFLAGVLCLLFWIFAKSRPQSASRLPDRIPSRYFLGDVHVGFGRNHRSAQSA